jgi:hypothetical protein
VGSWGRARWIVVCGGVAIIAASLGRYSARAGHRGSAAPEGAVEGPPSGADVARPSGKKSPRFPPVFPLAPAASSSDAEDAAERAAARTSRAQYLLGDVFKQLDAQANLGTIAAESRADAVLPYLAGVLRGALQADPGMRSAFAAQFTSTLCDRTVHDDQAITVANMALILPDVATAQGFDCFFSAGKEDVPTWKMLDAWQRSGLELTPALARLKGSAHDSRTTRRFLPQDEQIAQRHAEIANQ